MIKTIWTLIGITAGVLILVEDIDVRPSGGHEPSPTTGVSVGDAPDGPSIPTENLQSNKTNVSPRGVPPQAIVDHPTVVSPVEIKVVSLKAPSPQEEPAPPQETAMAYPADDIPAPATAAPKAPAAPATTSAKVVVPQVVASASAPMVASASAPINYYEHYRSTPRVTHYRYSYKSKPTRRVFRGRLRYCTPDGRCW